MSHILNPTLCVLIIINIKSANNVRIRYYPRYHLAPPRGLVSHSNGFSLHEHEYHLFYQYSPNNILQPGVWGHAKSFNLINWQHLPVATSYEVSGVFSGIALAGDGKTHLYYICNINYLDQVPDKERKGCLVIRKHGSNITKYKQKPNIKGTKRRPNFRNPTIWEHDDKYYMVLGKSLSNNTSLGQIHLYESNDKISWQQVSLLYHSNGTLDLGHKWEYPEFFKFQKRHVLLFSLRSIDARDRKKSFQCGYVVGNFNYSTYIFTPITAFKVLDHGHDFYATQTAIDKSGQRVLLAWFNMWHENKLYPEVADGFAGVMTIPRTLALSKSNRLLQRPVRSIAAARGEILRRGYAYKRARVVLKDKAGEIKIKADKVKNIEVFIGTRTEVVVLSYSFVNGTVTLDRGGNDGIRIAMWLPRGFFLRWSIYIDASSVELFCGAIGEVTLSSRFFPKGPVSVWLGNDSEALEFNVVSLIRTVTINSQAQAIDEGFKPHQLDFSYN